MRKASAEVGGVHMVADLVELDLHHLPDVPPAFRGARPGCRPHISTDVADMDVTVATTWGG